MNKSLTVLHIEDEPSDARLLKLLLERDGHPPVTLTQVDRMSDALQSLKERPYDVALLDLLLPDEKGLSSILTLQAHSPLLPIVVYTGLPGLDMAREAILSGADDYAVKGDTDAFTLVRKLYTSVDRHRLKRDLYAEMASLKAENQALQELCYHDPLTCLYNRSGLEMRAMALFRRSVGEAYATLINVDELGAINARYGFHAGDQVLQELAQLLLDCGRGRNLIGRWGGDEFLVLSQGSRQAAVAQAQALRHGLKVDLGVRHQLPEQALTCCQSISFVPPQASLASTVEASRAALLQAKRSGKDRVLGAWDLSAHAL